MFSIIHKRFGAALLATALLLMQSCNKEFDDIPTVTKPVPSNTIGEIIEADASFSILKVAVTKAGLMPVLKNPHNKLTFFATDDDAFAASGLSLAIINAMPAAQLNAILSFNIVPQSLPSSAITALFPPLQMPTLLPLDPNNPLVKMNIFIAKRGTVLYANNLPVKQPDIAAGNGVIHKVVALVAPPSKLLSSLIYDDPQLSIFEAAILRGDVGSSGLSSIDFLLKYAVVNFTVFAPTNDAMKVVINQLSGGAVPMGAPDQVFIDFINNFVPVQTAKGIVAYHILGTRAFAANLPTTPTYIPTLVNMSVPSHPGVQVQSSFTGPFATGLTVTGVGNAGVASNVIALDKNAVNGVLQIIDRVLLPQ